MQRVALKVSHLYSTNEKHAQRPTINKYTSLNLSSRSIFKWPPDGETINFCSSSAHSGSVVNWRSTPTLYRSLTRIAGTMTGKLNTKPCRKSLNKLCASSRDKQIYQKMSERAIRVETYYRLHPPGIVLRASFTEQMRGWQSFE